MLALTLLLSISPAVPPDLCQRALAVAPQRHCAAARHGVVLAETDAEAARLAGYLVAGETRFTRHFDRPIGPYVVAAAPPVLDAAPLTAAGFDHVLTWPTGAAFRQATRRGIEQAARSFAASQNMDPDQTRQVVENALSRAPDDTALAAIDSGMMPHELGHLLFTATFWPDARPEAGERPKHYGGPGPDWLDEAAAIVMEDQATADQRRAQFAELMRGETVASIGPLDARPILTDLPGLLERPHPGMARLNDPTAPRPPMTGIPGSGAQVGVTYTPAGPTGRGPRPGALDTVFYVQIRRFVDYLIERSGQPTILAEIAGAIASGETMETWLQKAGSAHGLPPSVAALDDDWRRSIEAA